MATYIKSVSNSIEQGRDFPVVNALDLGHVYSNIRITKTGTSRWSTKNGIVNIGRITIAWDDVLPKTSEEIYKAWRSHFIYLNNTYGYGGNNRYSVRFNVGNGNYLCSDCYDVSASAGITTINDVWADNLSRSWDGYSLSYPSLGFTAVTPSWSEVFGGWISVTDPETGKVYYEFGSCKHSAEDTTYYDFPWQGSRSTDLYCLDDIPDFGFQDIIEKSDEYGYYSEGGGYGGGSFDDSSDAFGLPSLPSLGVSEAGFVNVYKATAGQLVGFADELFPDFEMPTPSTKEGIDGVVENLNNVASVLGFFADSYLNKGLIDYVIDCHIVPVAPAIADNTGIKVGYKTFDYNPSKVTSDYVEFDCGTLQIAEYYQNFLDYSGTRAKCYCPFIGFVDIKPEWFQSGSLRLVYHFNIIDGSCIAFVIATSSKSQLKNTVVATFGGNCCVHMPITGLNYSSMISGILGGAGKVLSGIQGGGIGQIARGVEQGVLARPTLEQSNGYNAGMSFMCYRRPYLLIERPVASFSKNYPSEQGLPLNVTKKLGTMKGFTTCTAPVVDNFHCLEEEKEMVKQALIEGTIF